METVNVFLGVAALMMGLVVLISGVSSSRKFYREDGMDTLDWVDVGKIVFGSLLAFVGLKGLRIL